MTITEKEFNEICSLLGFERKFYGQVDIKLNRWSKKDRAIAAKKAWKIRRMKYGRSGRKD